MISKEKKEARRIVLLQSKKDKFLGKTFGRLTVTDFTRYKNSKGILMCLAICQCGGDEKEYIFRSLENGNTTSCGCKSRTDIEQLIKENTEKYVGKTFGKLTINKIIGYANTGWDIRCSATCDCGNSKQFSLYAIQRGTTTSCGCNIGKAIKHGLLKHPLYGIWSGIKQRCYNKKVPAFRLYGAKGIVMCDEWKNDFKPFYEWCIKNGWEKGLEVDKDIKPKLLGMAPKVYSPEFCSIVTGKENSNNKGNNRMLNIHGAKMTIMQASEKFSIPTSTIHNRLNRGLSDFDATHTHVSYKSTHVPSTHF